MIKLKHSVLALCVGLSLIACGGGGGDSGGSTGGGSNGGGGEQPGGGQDNGTTDTNVVRGLVTDSATGLRLANVTVTGGGKTVKTSATGEYALTLPASDKPVTLSFNADNYAPGFDNVVVNGDSDALLVALKKQGDLQDYLANTTKTIYQVTEAGPYAVIFQPNTLDSQDTNLRVSVTPLDPTIEADVLPGELGSSGAMLTPLTFAEFTILDSAGKHVNLRQGSEAVVELPIPPTLRDRPEYGLGQTIHCYSFNPNTGQWEDFVVGTVTKSSVDGQTPVVMATVKHFSWYGAAPDTDDCEWVVGTIVSAVDGKPLPGARVEAFPGTVTKSDGDGFFKVVTAKGSNTEIVATRTYTDTDGSISGTPGAKIIEFGKVKPSDLYPLVSCGDALQAASARAATTPVFDEDYPRVEIKMGMVESTSYEASAFLMDSSIMVGLKLIVPEENTDTNIIVSDAIVKLTDSKGETTTIPEYTVDSGTGTQHTGTYLKSLTVTPGERYDLTIDVDGNGTIDGSGFVYAVGEIDWTNPIEGSSVSAANFSASWTDTASGMSGYAPVYFAYFNPVDADTSGLPEAYYQGSNRSFDVKTAADNAPLSAGEYTGSLAVFSGAASVGSTTFDVTNNITGSTVNGAFWSINFKKIDSFTVTP